MGEGGRARGVRVLRRRARHEAEPPLLKCLRKYCNEIIALQELAERGLKQRRSTALADIECRLRSLVNAMADDIQKAKRDVCVTAHGT
jgi:hypothetical protein